MHASGKRDARSVKPSEWEEAISRVNDGEGLRAVARAYNIPHETLNRRVQQENVAASRRGPEPRMSRAGEEKLVKWLLANESIGRCVPMSCFIEKACEIARAFGDDKFVAGRDWRTRFFARYPQLSKRTPELTERSRMYALHPLKMKEYFDKLEPLLEGREATHIWNVDESGFDRSNLNIGKVVATRGSRHVTSPNDGNRERISYCHFFNAAGDYLPPIIIIPGQRMSISKRELMSGFPDANYIQAESSTQTEETWAQCASFFVREVAKMYPGGKHLLLLDGHSSRVSMEAVHDFRAAGNDIFTLPPHSSHVTQPFDVVIAKTIKTELAKALNNIRMGIGGEPGVSIGNSNVMKGFKIAFNKTVLPRVDPETGDTYTLGESGFAKCGIVPFNRNIIEKRYQEPALWFEDEIASKKEPQAVVPIDERVVIVENLTAQLLEAGDVAELLAKKVKAKREHCVPGCTLLTGDAHIAKSLAADEIKAAKEAAIKEKKEERTKRVEMNRAAMEARAARVAAKRASKAAAVGLGPAADDGDAAVVPVAPSSGATIKVGKRKRRRHAYMEVDAREVSRKGAGKRRAERMAAREDQDE